MATFGDFFARFRRKPAATVEVGQPGVQVFGGRVDEGDKSPDLTGRRLYLTLTDLIKNTAVVAAGSRAYLDLAGSAGWRMDAADDTASAEEKAEFVDKAIHKATRPWHRIVRRSSTYVFHGHDVQEVTLKRLEDGAVGLGSVDPRPQHTLDMWDTDDHGNVVGVLQVTTDGLEFYLPIWKCVYVVDDSLTDSPRGLGLLRQCVPAAKRLAHYEVLEGKGFETDLRGVPVGRAPLQFLRDQLSKGIIDQVEYDAVVNPVKTFLRGHVRSQSAAPLAVMLDSMTERSLDDAQAPSSIYSQSIELMNGDSQGFAEIAAAIQRQNHEIARILGVEHLMLGQDRGTQALSQDKTATMRTRIEGILSDLAWTFQRDIVDPICRANAWPEEQWPSIEHEPLRQSKLEELVGAFESMARAGAPLSPDDPAINVIRDVMKMPHAPELDLQVDAALARPTEMDDDPADPNAAGEDVDPEDAGDGED